MIIMLEMIQSNVYWRLIVQQVVGEMIILNIVLIDVPLILLHLVMILISYVLQHVHRLMICMENL